MKENLNILRIIKQCYPAKQDNKREDVYQYIFHLKEYFLSFKDDNL